MLQDFFKGLVKQLLPGFLQRPPLVADMILCFQNQGKWYVTAFASDCEEFLKHKDMMKIVAAHVTYKEDSKLLITTSFPK